MLMTAGQNSQNRLFSLKPQRIPGNVSLSTLIKLVAAQKRITLPV